MENNFEKEVQKNLANLNISPSEKIWEQIENRLRKRKRKRGLIWWFLPVLVLPITVGINYLIPDKPVKDGVAVPIVQSAPGREERHIADRIPKTHSDNPDKQIQEKAENNNLGRRPAAAESIDRKAAGAPAFVPEARPASGKVPGPFEPVILPAGQPVPLLSKNIPVILLLPEFEISPLGEIKKAHMEKKKLESPKKAKWEFGLVFSPGISYLTENSSKMTGTGNLASDPAFGLNQNSNQGSYLNNWVSPPSYTKDVAFRVGFAVTRNLTDKISLNTGLQYRRSSVRQTSEFFSVANRAFAEQQSKNVFHFLELPLEVNLKTDVGGLRMKWEAGTNLSYLLSANALQYNGSRYYKNNSLFSKIAPGVNAGLSVRIIETSGISIYAGPEYRYYPCKLAEEGTFSNQHFNFAGLKTNISFYKKKATN